MSLYSYIYVLYPYRVVLKKLKCKGTLSKSTQSFPLKAQNGPEWLFSYQCLKKTMCFLYIWL